MQTNKNSNLFLTMGKAFKKSGELNDVKCFKLKIYDHQKSGLKFLVFWQANAPFESFYTPTPKSINISNIHVQLNLTPGTVCTPYS